MIHHLISANPPNFVFLGPGEYFINISCIFQDLIKSATQVSPDAIREGPIIHGHWTIIDHSTEASVH